MEALGAKLRDLARDKDELVTFEKYFYEEEHSVPLEAVEKFRQVAHIMPTTPKGENTVLSMQEFKQTGFLQVLMKEFDTAGFTEPTPIQAYGWPVVLKGYDVIGIAQTGSGKSLTFIAPAILHIRAQAPLQSGNGPLALFLVPTRELAAGLAAECSKFGSSGVRNICVVGGTSREPQVQALTSGVEIVIATPVRLMSFLESGRTNLKCVSYLVLDETDRMLDMGFEAQIRSIVSQTRSDRQTLLWSATWSQEVQLLARDVMMGKHGPVRITAGDGEISITHTVVQIIE